MTKTHINIALIAILGLMAFSCKPTAPGAVQNSDIAADAVTADKIPLDSDLSTIAGLTPTNGSFLVGNGSAWTSRSVTNVKSDLGLGFFCR